MIAAVPGIFAASSIVSSLVGLYGIAKDVNSWIDEHLESMQESENQTIANTGKILTGAKFGFGMGYTAPMIAIATGQMLLGNTFGAITTTITAMTFTNPIAMTCASIGAIYYGWSALNDEEKNNIIDKLSEGLSIGIEFIKSVIRYISERLSGLFTKQKFDDFKKLILKAATAFGKTLYDVTHDKTDWVLMKIAEMLAAAETLWELISKPFETRKNIEEKK